MRLVETGGLLLVEPALSPASGSFTTRGGGASGPPYASLNLGAGSGDDPETVGANADRLAAALGVSRGAFARIRQVHGAEVAVAEGPGPAGAPLGEFDAAVTDRPGLVLLVLAADCVPLLLVDPVRPAVGAVHAGWRGIVADAPGAAVRRMCAAFGSRPSDLRAAIGPCIGICCYEVDGPVAARFSAAGLPFDRVAPADGAIARPAAARDGRPRWRLDLAAAVAARLRSAGLAGGRVETAGLCTACRPDLLFSHRRDGARTGRQAGLVWLREAPERECAPRSGARPEADAQAGRSMGGTEPGSRICAPCLGPAAGDAGAGR